MGGISKHRSSGEKSGARTLYPCHLLCYLEIPHKPREPVSLDCRTVINDAGFYALVHHGKVPIADKTPPQAQSQRLGQLFIHYFRVCMLEFTTASTVHISTMSHMTHHYCVAMLFLPKLKLWPGVHTISQSMSALNWHQDTWSS